MRRSPPWHRSHYRSRCPGAWARRSRRRARAAVGSASRDPTTLLSREDSPASSRGARPGHRQQSTPRQSLTGNRSATLLLLLALYLGAHAFLFCTQLGRELLAEVFILEHRANLEFGLFAGHRVGA